jgi:hypothetical protein
VYLHLKPEVPDVPVVPDVPFTPVKPLVPVVPELLLSLRWALMIQRFLMYQD